MIALFVIAIHLGLLGIGTLWKPTAPTPKPRSKVIVQTIRLQPFQSTTTQNPTPLAPPPTDLSRTILDLPKEQFNTDSTPLLTQLSKEDILFPQEVSIKTEAPLKEEAAAGNIKEENSVATALKETPPPTIIPPHSAPPLPIKKDIAPPPPTLSPQHTIHETPKTIPVKKTAPVKKPTEPIKKDIKSGTVNSKLTEELEKKRKQEKEIEKKQQKEQAELEKKRQKELEAEKKRQKELAEAQEAARQREQALLIKAKENLAKMSETRDKISTSSSLNIDATTLPKELISLQVDALPVGEIGNIGEWGIKEMSYSHEVASRLKMSLCLPDYGAIKIKLTLDHMGKVMRVETIQSESNKNKSYVESKIPLIFFSSFGQRFQGATQKTFEITLQNDS
jgi:colicin import membrane protein